MYNTANVYSYTLNQTQVSHVYLFGFWYDFHVFTILKFGII
jgi:hypothetical protein